MNSWSQTILSGVVKASSNNNGIPGVTVTSVITKEAVMTDDNGSFTVMVKANGEKLFFEILGFKKQEYDVDDTGAFITVYMEEESTILDEVEISTGYYTLSKERATGSFVYLDNELLNRSTSIDIISRLEGITNSLAFNRSSSLREGETTPSLRIRGLSTIHSYSEPLIIVDNFPFEGNIQSINPNDVEDITILKDAAAASIWGARAGNGVIVIKTKKGALNQPLKIAFNSNFTIAVKPDLFYSKSFLESADVIDVERFLFDKKFYVENNWTPLSPAVELFIKNRDDKVLDSEFEIELSKLKNTDIRKEALKHLYRNSTVSQYALNLSGGTSNVSYYLSTSIDKSLSNKIGDEFNRLSLTSYTSFMPIKGVTINSRISYFQLKSLNNGIAVSDLPLGSGHFPYPYTTLMDENGMALPVAKRNRILYNESAVELGLLDWQYRPLEEVNISDNSSNSNEIKINTGLNIAVLKNTLLDIKYQYERTNSETRNYYDKESYYTRDLVNRFTQNTLEQIIPYGSILEGGNSKNEGHYGRLQLNYDAVFNNQSRINAIGGVEVRQRVSSNNPGYLVYNYNDELITGRNNFDYTKRYTIRPRSSELLPSPPSGFSHITDRFLSYYFNAAYNLKSQYSASISTRWDASNLFGVKANQKGVPLWSVGLAWDISKAQFYAIESLPFLKIRTTYGFNGNINPRLSAFPIIAYSSDGYTGERIGIIMSMGNPELSWEKISTLNFGLDFKALNDRVTGSFELYRKKGVDLIGANYVAPTTGMYDTGTGYSMSNLMNYANMLTKGIDIEISSINTMGKIGWSTVFLFNQTRNKVTNYMANINPVINNYFSIGAEPVVIGNSKDAIYVLPWNGLDPITGNPIARHKGIDYSNYTEYMRSFSQEDLINAGVHIPRYFGSIRNIFKWRSIQLSSNITWAAGFKFRRSTIHYENLFNTGTGHQDFILRWKNPGDELLTNVPSMPDANVTNRDRVYSSSEIMLEDGAHIRLKDIIIKYGIRKQLKSNVRMKIIDIFFNAKDLGIIWSANKKGIDPSYAYSVYPPSKSFSLGIQASF